MLLLGRKIGETIEINGGRAAGGITIVICKQTSTGIRIGIDADMTYHVKRGELSRDATTSPQSVSEEAKSRVQT